MSPTALNEFERNTMETKYNEVKNDIWGAGITVLCSLFNEDFAKYYDWDRCMVRLDLIKNRLMKLEDFGFSRQFVSVLEKMLEPDEKRRVSLHELVNLYERAKSTGNFTPILIPEVNKTRKQEQNDNQYKDMGLNSGQFKSGHQNQQSQSQLQSLRSPEGMGMGKE